MTISEIKQNLTLSQVLAHYNLTPDKNNHLHCPWHEDKKASLQVNLEKNFYKCHGCGKHGDQIQWIEDFEKLTKAEAINKAVQLVMNYELGVMSEKENTKEIKPYEYREIPTENLEEFFAQLKKNIVYSQNAQNYLQQRKLDHKILEIGYNGKTYKNLRNCVVFPLRNINGGIASFYGRSVLIAKNEAIQSKHFYLKNRSGIYPNYPNPETKKLILTESIIDASSLLPLLKEAPFGGWGIIACYGTNGLNDEILNAIKNLEKLEEIIFAFDNDEAGKEAIKKYANQLKTQHSKLKTTSIELPNKDINETLQLHEKEVFIELLTNRKEIIFSIEKSTKQETKNLKLNTQNSTTDFLKQKDLLKNLNELIGKAGIVGEENSRLLLFLILISYLNKNPIHGIVQGSSGSGKTHMIGSIADLMPQEDVFRFTRITESSLYNWGEYDLFRKIIIIEDLDGLKEEALYSLRELISNQFLSSSVSVKDKKGNNKSAKKEVKGQFSSLSATTKGETYEDNMSRSFLIAVDESKAQTNRIIEHQNRRNAGEIDPKEKQKAVLFIQQIVRSLQEYEVINPYATRLNLPEKVHKIRRLNEMYQAVIKQVTFLNQYQRKSSPNPSEGGEQKLITTIEDIEQATEILFESIVLKVDELDGSLRQFFERLKKFIKDENQDFLQREIRQAFNLSKTQLQRFINSLLELEYIKQSGGYNNKGVKYKISYWDNHLKFRSEIKEFLQKQINELRQEEK
jgi:DNA primase